MNSINKEIITFRVGTLECFLFNAGSFKSDGGASMGVFPKALWETKLPPDPQNRIELATNLLLIKTNTQIILIDSGIGYYHDKKRVKIYDPEPCRLLENLKKCGVTKEEISIVILTHLHHDHIGGLLYKGEEGDTLMFPNAQYLIQKEEWDIAIEPDELNQAAYRHGSILKLLKQSSHLKLINGDLTLEEGISLIKTGGHSTGTQIVRLYNTNELCYYPGDIIPNQFHLNLSVTSAYDISRQETYRAKKRIIEEVKEKKGLLIFNHQTSKMMVKFPLS